MTIWLSDAEWVEITALAEAMGVTRPRVYTAAVESGGQVFDRVAIALQRARRVDAQLTLRVLAGVANNLNQITHSMHAEGQVDRAELAATLQQVGEAVGQVQALVDEARVE